MQRPGKRPANRPDSSRRPPQTTTFDSVHAVRSTVWGGVWCLCLDEEFERSLFVVFGSGYDEPAGQRDGVNGPFGLSARYAFGFRLEIQKRQRTICQTNPTLLPIRNELNTQPTQP